MGPPLRGGLCNTGSWYYRSSWLIFTHMASWPFTVRMVSGWGPRIALGHAMGGQRRRQPPTVVDMWSALLAPSAGAGLPASGATRICHPQGSLPDLVLSVVIPPCLPTIPCGRWGDVLPIGDQNCGLRWGPAVNLGRHLPCPHTPSVRRPGPRCSLPL